MTSILFLLSRHDYLLFPLFLPFHPGDLLLLLLLAVTIHRTTQVIVRGHLDACGRLITHLDIVSVGGVLQPLLPHLGVDPLPLLPHHPISLHRLLPLPLDGLVLLLPFSADLLLHLVEYLAIAG